MNEEVRIILPIGTKGIEQVIFTDGRTDSQWGKNLMSGVHGPEDTVSVRPQLVSGTR